MRLATFTILVGLTLGATAAPSTTTSTSILSTAPSLVAYEVPGTENRGVDPMMPESPTQTDSSRWDDTADTSDDLNVVDVDKANAELENGLNNDVHDPLLEDHTVEPVDVLPTGDRDRALDPASPVEDPFADPLP